MPDNRNARYNAATYTLDCEGKWDIDSLSHLQQTVQDIRWPSSGAITIDGDGITKLDSAGAWLLNQLQSQLRKKKHPITLQGFSSEHSALLDIVETKLQEEVPLKIPERKPMLARIGVNTIAQLHEARDFLDFVGFLTVEAFRLLVKGSLIRWSSLASTIFRTGFQALPIIALLSFMIGVVIAYQMGLQLRNYGANIYIVDLLGLSILREFGPLITAIMVAGRTGSAYTAELGIMKINEEIDALDTMGVTPAELLLLPRIIGLTITLPLLTVWADIFGIFGGMVTSNSMLGITWYDFLHRFPHVIPLKSLILGIGKTPVFALLIASIGCYQGMRVSGSSDSVGKNTTRSVVLSIFFIIVADAIFSVIFSKLKL